MHNSLYLCAKCKKVFKADAAGKRIKCKDCSDILLDMNIKMEEYACLDNEEKRKVKERILNNYNNKDIVTQKTTHAESFNNFSDRDDRDIDNDYIEVHDIKNIHKKGIYIVGEDLPEGEYYFWGKEIDISIGETQILSSREWKDGYAYLFKKRKLTVEKGYFTSIDNIIYRFTAECFIQPNHVYRSGYEIPFGKYEYPLNEAGKRYVGICRVHTYKNSPLKFDDKFKYTYEYEYDNNTACFIIDRNSKYIRIENGMARLLLKDTSQRSRITENIESDKRNEYIKEVKKKKYEGIIDGDKLWFYVSIGDPITEVFINDYYKDCTMIKSPYSDDDTINYKFSVKKNNKDEICLVYYLYINNRLCLPKVYNIPLNELFYYAWSRNAITYTRKDVVAPIYEKLELDSIKGLKRFFRKFENIYPYWLIVEYNPMISYTKQIHPEFDKRFYYHASNNESYYSRMYLKHLIDLAERGLVNARWRSEFSLYLLVRSYFQDAEYQYRSSWLGKQSLDIFIPCKKIGIEYQGKQHYDEVALFGGSEGFESRRKLDNQKREKCEDAGVLLIEWKYNTSITDDNLKHIMELNNIRLPEKKDFSFVTMKGNKEKETSKVIYQYDLKGNYITEYPSIKEANEAVGSKNIGKVINGQQQVAGGYLWRKVIKGHPKDKWIVAIDDNNNNNGEKKAICQMDDEGNVIQIFESVTKASKDVGVNAKSIRLTANGKQKHAGGYCWRFM